MSTIPAPAGGIVGVIRRAFSSASGATKAGISVFSKPEIWAVRLAMAAGILAIYMKSGADEGWTLPVIFSLCIGIAGLMFEASSAKNVMRSFWEGRAGGMMIWSCLWLCALSYSGFQWISVAAENESGKTNLHQAALFKSQDARESVELAAKKVMEARQKSENLRKAAWEAIPVVDGVQILSASQAEALMQKYQANTRFWNLTDGCKSTKGPQTRKYCDSFNSAKAARDSALTRQTTAEDYKASESDVKAAENELAKARSLAANTKVETSKERADLRILASFFGWEGDKADEKAEQLTSVFKIVAVSIFVSLGSMMIELERLRSTSKPFGWTLRFKRWFCRVFLGREPQGVTIDERTEIHNHFSDEEAKRMLREAGRAARARLYPQEALA